MGRNQRQFCYGLFQINIAPNRDTIYDKCKANLLQKYAVSKGRVLLCYIVVTKPEKISLLLLVVVI